MDILPAYPAWLIEHGAALAVVLPLLTGAVCAVLRSERAAWIVTLIVTGACAVVSFGVLLTIFAGEVQIYEMGGWEPPYGIAYVIDGLNAPVLFLISAIAFIGTLYGIPSVTAEVEPGKRAPFYGAFLLCVAGLLGMVVTGDAFNVFVFLEVSSISTYVLVAMGASRDRRALAAACRYLILGSIGATLFVVGVGCLYMETGTLNMLDMSRILSEIGGGSRVALVGFGFIVIGLGLKLAMFPLHLWLPGAYAHAPSFVTVFLASTATKAALYLLLRFMFVVFDPSFEYDTAIITYVITTVAVAGMLLASLQAVYQTDARRTLAYSSIAQVGYMLLGIGMATAAGLSAGYLHLINHALIKGALFLALGAFWYRYGIMRVLDFRGLGQIMPWTMGAFTLGGLSLIGVPFTAGFVSKYNLAMAAAANGWWWAVGVIMAASVLAIIYMGRMLLVAYFQPPPEVDGEAVAKNEAPLLMLVPMWVLAGLSILIGINADWIVHAADGAAMVLTAGGGVRP
ncbi:MAG: monovalent cation/H+ antiporter subunit D family protein [Hyphomonadaceae bacterium]|nr:monovalent cation/H+ antiporter subunit D family protein [Hyphomonadaceae bacterium]MBC6411522.1 monovalent cation/H+ antiporter subunit D family protein [Hyphomonadaceae bacterium]